MISCKSHNKSMAELKVESRCHDFCCWYLKSRIMWLHLFIFLFQELNFGLSHSECGAIPLVKHGLKLVKLEIGICLRVFLLFIMCFWSAARAAHIRDVPPGSRISWSNFVKHISLTASLPQQIINLFFAM